MGIDASRARRARAFAKMHGQEREEKIKVLNRRHIPKIKQKHTVTLRNGSRTGAEQRHFSSKHRPSTLLKATSPSGSSSHSVAINVIDLSSCMPGATLFFLLFFSLSFFSPAWTRRCPGLGPDHTPFVLGACWCVGSLAGKEDWALPSAWHAAEPG